MDGRYTSRTPSVGPPRCDTAASLESLEGKECGDLRSGKHHPTECAATSCGEHGLVAFGYKQQAQHWTTWRDFIQNSL
ncbi:hypothetical protein HU200_050395 [Digitaria exilis]|uniref:Uncharacterized protein n=1 Tax=Digitaria exilis TaxID=1010633 RepID=A0A835ARK8_9POAL|nr:hypothetical protein HU200_050395 [Digitaria exilis]